MLNGSESIATFILIAAVVVILVWGYNRAKAYGRLGILAWLQSIALMSPWLLFFGLFALGIYLNLVGILFLLVASIAVYIWLGRKLRAEGQEALLQQKAAERIKQEAAKSEESPQPSNSKEFDNNTSQEISPFPMKI